jgi:hypothetical protein
VFSNYARTLDFFNFSVGVGDDPMTANELYGFGAFIGDLDGVQEKPLLLIWARTRRIVLRLDPNPHPSCDCFRGKHNNLALVKIL